MFRGEWQAGFSGEKPLRGIWAGNGCEFEGMFDSAGQRDGPGIEKTADSVKVRSQHVAFDAAGRAWSNLEGTLARACAVFKRNRSPILGGMVDLHELAIHEPSFPPAKKHQAAVVKVSWTPSLLGSPSEYEIFGISHDVALHATRGNPPPTAFPGDFKHVFNRTETCSVEIGGGDGRGELKALRWYFSILP
jgi:hypothetical protein